MSVTLTLFNLWKEKEKQTAKRITVADIADATNLQRNTVTGLLYGKSKRLDIASIGKLCEYFNLPPGPVPFIVYQPTTQDAPGALGSLTREEQIAAIYELDDDAGEEDNRPPLSYKEQMEAINAPDIDESNIPF